MCVHRKVFVELTGVVKYSLTTEFSTVAHFAIVDSFIQVCAFFARTESIVRKNSGEVWYLLAKDEGHGFRKKNKS